MRALAVAAFCALVLTASGQRTHPAVPFVTGAVETIHSNVLGEERTLNIALPQGYHPDSAARYPVVYLLDGGADEDFIHIAGLFQFSAFDWIAWQKPSIVVGIANVDRKRDLTYPTRVAKDKADFPTTGGSAAFIRFLGEELIPFVEANYRVAAKRTLIGQSLGGLFAAEVLVERQELFQRYIIVSPSLWWDEGSLLKRAAVFTDPAKAAEQVYIAVGKEGKVMVSGARQLATLAKKNPTTRVGFSYLKDHDHANILHRAVLDGVRWMGGSE